MSNWAQRCGADTCSARLPSLPRTTARLLVTKASHVQRCTFKRRDVLMIQAFHWPRGRSCAVSLTYDDTLPVHFEYVGPALEARGVLGTFYLLIKTDLKAHFERWRALG